MGTQLIRPAEQVLWAPRHATCLDLAVVLAGACLTAGLHPVDRRPRPADGASGVGHSVVLVRLDRDLAPRTDGRYADDVWREPPAGLLDDQLQASLDGPDGDVLAVDPVGFARSLGTTRITGLDVDLRRRGRPTAPGTCTTGAVAARGGRRPRLARHRPPAPVALPAVEPLRPPYRAPDTAESPLRLLRAEYALVPFQARDELTVLRDWCREITTGAATGIGGDHRRRRGREDPARRWSSPTGCAARAGTPARCPKNPAGVDWLAGVVSPVLVVLDYADGRVDDAIALLAALRRRVGPPAVVLLTARSLEGEWLADIVEALDSDTHPYRREPIGLPDHHPDAVDVYHRTVAALTDQPGRPTTAAAGHPVDHPGLRAARLDRRPRHRRPPRDTRRAVRRGAAPRGELLVHRLPRQRPRSTPQPEAAPQSRGVPVARRRPRAAAPTRSSTAVDDLRDDPRERHDVRDTLITCLQPAPGEGLGLRPDPVGDHLVLTELGTDDRPAAPRGRRRRAKRLAQAVITLVRAGQNDPDTATDLITALHRRRCRSGGRQCSPSPRPKAAPRRPPCELAQSRRPTSPAA